MINTKKPDYEKFIAGAALQEQKRPTAGEKSPAGRKPLAEEQKATKFISVYLTEEERAKVNTEMKRRHISFSSYVKNKLFQDGII